ncbi:MAG: glucose-6-phosphate dehydrogenase [Gammaproteobacteria bacterium]
MPDVDLRNSNTSFVLFGAGGDLAQRLIVPALFNLFVDHHLPEQFLLLGVDRKELDDAALAAHYQTSVAQFSRRGVPAPAEWQAFAAHIRYQAIDVTTAQGMATLAARLKTLEANGTVPAQRVFYMAVPPSLFAPIANGLGGAGLAEPRATTRIVVEKPLGSDLESFLKINAALLANFAEAQIYRIDHFLGKETVQNILAMRFANPMFEPVWNRRYIDHVAITVAETLGVEGRAGYYEHAGALRDMVQNHLFQLLCIVAMEPPISYDADDVRNKKLDVLRALRPITPDAVADCAVRGQYGAGWVAGVKVAAYREEPGVAANSSTETYAALKLYVDNWRWQDVPFYLRTGKRMTAAVWEISIRFRDVPHRSFPAASGLNAQPSRLVIQMQPEQGIVLKFMAKEPGAQLRLRLVDMRFSYQQAFNTPSPDAYETLLWDVLCGDQTLFMRADQVEMAWRVLMPVLDAWAGNSASDFPNYPAGSWGPQAADALLARDGRNWLVPTLPAEK